MHQWLTKVLIWNGSLALFTSQMPPLLLASTVNLYDISFETKVQGLSSVLSIIFLSVTVAVVMIFFVKLTSVYRDLKLNENQDFLCKFGYLTKGIYYKTMKSGVYWKLFSLMRWILTIVIMVFLRNNPVW